MKKNSKAKREYYSSSKKDNKKKKKKGSDDKYRGLNTIAQVTGSPKSHVFHSSIPITPVKNVKEPLPVCPDCGERIQSIAEAFSTQDGAYVHFDCMLNRIRMSETLSEKQSISYVGKGNFAIVEKDADGKYFIVKSIPVEDEKALRGMKEYVESLKV